MAICLQTGLVINEEDMDKYDCSEAKKVCPMPPRGKARKPDGTIIDLPKKVAVVE